MKPRHPEPDDEGYEIPSEWLEAFNEGSMLDLEAVLADEEDGSGARLAGSTGLDVDDLEAEERDIEGGEEYVDAFKSKSRRSRRDREAADRQRRKRQHKIETLFRDEHLHAIQKPAGLSTVDDRWDPDADTVIDVLWRAWQKDDTDAPRPHVVHRLDRDTTGVIVFARHREAQRALREQFRRRTTRKSYVALAQGCPQPTTGTIEIQVDDDMRRAGRMRVVKRNGKECVTHYEVLETFRGYSWIQLRPITGRTHQIRVSLQAIGHPCAVDSLYGGERALFASHWIRNYKLGRGREELPIIDRVTLHAERLEITHPATGEPLIIQAPLAKDLAATLVQLRKHLA